MKSIENGIRKFLRANNKLGAVLSVVGFFNGLLLLYLLSDIYMVNVHGKMSEGRPDEAAAVYITFAMLSWLGVFAGAIWGGVLYGFIHKEKWAWFLGTIAAAMQMLAGFFPMIPPSSIDLPAPTVSVFLIGTVLWFAMLLIGGVSTKAIILIFVAGLAYVLTYVDGVATISKFQTTTYNDFWKSMYMMVQMVLWFGATAWFVFMFAVLKHKAWAVPLGIVAGLASMIGGYPLAIINIIEVERFSMFLPGPVIAMGLFIVLWFPGIKKLITGWETWEVTEAQ
jgi:hypothetical protein